MAVTARTPRGITARLTFMVTSILVVTFTVAGTAVLIEQRRQLSHALETKAGSLVSFMAEVSPLSILSLNFVEMANNAKKVVMTDDEAVCAVILNAQGIPLAEFFKASDPLLAGEPGVLAVTRHPMDAIEALRKTGRFLEVTAPITAGEKRIGLAVLGYSTDRIRLTLLDQATVVAAIQLAITGLSIALMVLVLRRILRPIRALTAAATQISTGDLDVVVTGTERPDELGVLSRAFRSMAEQLRGLIAGLEQRVTELQRTGAALQESEARFRAAFENANVGVCLVATDGRLLRVNDFMCRMFGYAREELERMTVNSIAHPDDREISPAFMARAVAGQGDRASFDKRYLHRDGRIIWGNVSTSIIRDPRGEPLHFISHIQDVTERRHAEDAQRRLNRELRAISNCNQTLMRAVDEQTLLRDICQIVCREAGYVMAWVGYAEKDAARTVRPVAWAGANAEYLAYSTLSWSEETEPGQGPVGTVIRTGKAVVVQDIASDPQAASWRERALERGYRSCLCLPLLDETSGVFGLLVIYSGEINVITADEVRLMEELAGDLAFGIATMRTRADRNRAEEDLRRTEARRHQLELQLLQAQKLESLGTLASGIAHDFNNILGIVLGHSSLLEQASPLPRQASRSVDSIQKAALRGASLVKQLLTFARKGESRFDSVSVPHVLQELLKLLEETLPKTIVVTTNLQPDIPLITADATQVHQVLLNLCLNARDAMPGGGSLTIEVTIASNAEVAAEIPRATAREYVRVTVTDTGVGMNEETLRRVFEPFYTTKGPGKGTGLGLALVYSIVESHHGLITVESAPGKGSRFRLFFPVEERTEARPPAPPGPIEIPGGTETILVIEDEALLAEMVGEMLVGKGYTVLPARDGEEGVTAFADHRGDIAAVLSDFGLPKFSGLEVVRRLKAIDPGVKVVIASGFLDPAARSELLAAGVLQIVPKPYLAAEVLRAIRFAIDGDASSDRRV